MSLRIVVKWRMGWPEAASLMDVGGGKSVEWSDSPYPLTCDRDDHERYSIRWID